MDCSPPGSSVQWSFQARILEWVAISFSRGSSQPRDHTYVSCLAGRFFTTEFFTTSEELWSYHYKLSFSEFGPYWELILVSSRKYQLHHGWPWVGELQLRWAVIKEAVYIPPYPPSLGYYLSFGWVCKAEGPLGEPLNAIGKGALSDESSSMGARLSV